MTDLTWEILFSDMENCEQTKGQSVRQHGESVWSWYKTLNEILAYGYNDPSNDKLAGKEKFRLPKWWADYEEDLAWERHSSNIALWYTTMHDCGKPYCKIVGEDGRYHFPEHARKSHEVWDRMITIYPHETLNIRAYGESEKTKGQIVGELILNDMKIHTIKAGEIDALIEDLGPRSVVTLLLVAICEIHSNAEMFGGIDSNSFKIKWKQIDRRGKAICKKLFGEPNSDKFRHES